MFKGVDVSYANGKVDWDAAKKAGLDFALIRCGYGDDVASQDDVQFERNVSECERFGIPWGPYFFSYASSLAQIQSEVAHTLRLLKGKKPTYPVLFDLEDADYLLKRGIMPTKQAMTDMAKTYLTAIENAGYYVGWYTYKSFYSGYVDAAQLSNWLFWFSGPLYSEPDLNVTKPNIPCHIWQYRTGETGGTWPGVGKCDVNVSYADYPAIIKSLGFNGWPKQEAKVFLKNTIVGAEQDVVNAAIAVLELLGMTIKVYSPSEDVLDNSDIVIGGAGALNGIPDTALNGAARIWGDDSSETTKKFQEFIKAKIPDTQVFQKQVADLTAKIEKARADLA